jgi:hypothetical protein
MAKKGKTPANRTPGTRSYLLEIQRIAEVLESRGYHEGSREEFFAAYPDSTIDEAIPDAVASLTDDIDWARKRLSDLQDNMRGLRALVAKRQGKKGDTACESCGTLFFQQRRTARYCSAKCRQAAKRQRDGYKSS